MSQKSRFASTDKRPQPISGIIGKVMSSMGMWRSYSGWMVVAKWPEIVGEPIASVAKAVRFAEGTLVVAVPDPSWRQTLTMEIDEILKEIHRYPYGSEVKQLRLVRAERGY